MQTSGAVITKEIAEKVLSVVDTGLIPGAGTADENNRGIPGKMCVEAAVCYALGLSHGDDPQCVSRALTYWWAVQTNDFGGRGFYTDPQGHFDTEQQARDWAALRGYAVTNRAAL